MEDNPSKPYRITLLDFTIAFVPFALLLSASLLVPESTLDLTFFRTIYTIWAATVLVTPALCAFFLPGSGDRQRALWLLFWTFSFIVFLVHTAYALLGVYEKSFDKFLAGQGLFPAIVNGLFLLWWSLDLYLAWFCRRDRVWIRRQRMGVHIFVALTFFASTVVLNRGFINVLGVTLALSVLICLVVAFDARRARRSTAPSSR